MTTNQTPPDLTLDSGPLTCHNCGAIFSLQLVMEELAGAQAMRAGGLIISRLEGACTHCGAITHWAIRDRQLKEIALKYGEIVQAIRVYNPE